MALALCDTLHELAHVAAALLPVQVSQVAISSVGISTRGSSPLVALAGPLANLLLALFLVFARSPSRSSRARYFAWIFGTSNLFDATAYLLYSALLGSGDWATVFDAALSPHLWRPVIGVAGIAAYAASVLVSLRVLRLLIADGVVTLDQARRYGPVTYWAGGLVLTAAAALNPISPWLILTSGVATGFGAMAGFVLMPALLKQIGDRSSGSATPIRRFGVAWAATGILVATAFVVVLGRGLQFGARG